MSEGLRREYGLRDLILFHITAIVTLRWISFSAARGPSSLSLWALAFFAFLLPIAYVVIDFTRKMPQEGGLYQWIKNTLGHFHGFVAAWCYVVNNLFYFPSLLVAVAGYAAFTLVGDRQDLQNNISFVRYFALAALWATLILNLIGVRFGKWVQNIGGLSIWIPGTILILLGMYQFIKSGSVTDFSMRSLFPDFRNYDTWSVWAQICFAFTGIELASTMSEEVKDPVKSIPKSIYIACVIITAIYILGTISILVTIGSENTNLVTGIMQAIAAVLSSMGLSGMITPIAVLLTLGGLGTLAAWLAGAARLPYTVGVDRYLPQALGKLHPRWGTPYVSLLTLGCISSVIIWMSFSGASVKETYTILVNACLILYFIPFAYLFVAHFWMNWKTDRKPLALVLALVGLISTLAAIVLACIPAPETENKTRYVLEVVGGSFGLVVVSMVLYWNARRKGTAVPAV